MSTQSTIHDTNPETELMLIELIRNKPAHVRLGEAIAASNRVAMQCKNAIRRRHPEFSDNEVKLRFIELNYGNKMANELRAWLTRTADER